MRRTQFGSDNNSQSNLNGSELLIINLLHASFWRIVIFFSILLPQMLFPNNWQTDTLQVLPGDSVIVLSHRYILPSSIDYKYLTNDTLQFDSLKIDALNGKISGFTTPSDKVSIIASYQFLNLDIPSQKIINPPPRIYLPKKSGKIAKVNKVSPSKIKTSTNYDFLRSGTIYRCVTIGSGSGLSLKSGLNLELQGKISEDISIIGTLTDQNIPIQPEGNTQTLDEIDKVFIKIKMPNEQITFGDYELSLPGGELGSYHRKLQGIYGESDRNFGKTVIGGAVTKGQYHTNFFMGDEGNQGPYQLCGKDGETAIIVLAGTEKVWINGKALSRGENADYVIDYSTGEVTFTPKQLITSDSRITVDFQYSNFVYAKNIWLARNSTTFLNEKLQLSAGFINESDDKENPIELLISKSDRAKLKSAGDNEMAAFQSTIIADSSGVYILEDSILVFVGIGNGTHSAAFYNVGTQGQYRKKYTADIVYFEWVSKSDPAVTQSDKEEAVYLPAKPLKLPKKQRLYHVSGTWNPSRNFSIMSEFAMSDYDRNTFSPYDDLDNKGNAINVKTSFTIPISKISKLSFLGKFREEGERFNPIDRHQVVEYRRRWDLPSDSTQGEKYYEGLIKYNLKDALLCSFEGGAFSQGDIHSERYKLGGSLNYKWFEKNEFYQEKITRTVGSLSSRNWVRRKAFSQLKVFKIKPYVGIYYEKRDGDINEESNFQFLEQTYGFESSSERKIRWKIENHLRRDDDYSNEQWITKTRSQNINFSGQILNWKSLSSQWNYTKRIKKYYGDSSLPDIDFQLIYLMLKHDPKKLPFRWETNMKVEEERTVKKEWRYFYVGKGEGQFLYDSTFADYVPHPQGDYVLRITPSNIKEPVTSFQNGIRLRFNGSSLKSKISRTWLKNIVTLTDIRLQQQIKKSDNPFKLWTFSPSNIDDKWAYFNRIIQQDVTYRIKSLRGNIRFRLLNSNRISQLDVRGREKNVSNEYSVRYKGAFIWKIKLDSEMSSKELKRNSVFNSLRDRNIKTIKYRNSFSYLLNKVHYLEYEIIVNRDVQKTLNPTRSFLTSIKGSYERKIKRKGRWKVFSEIDNVKVTPKGNPIPWEMSKGKKEGATIGWGTSVEYRIGKYLSIRVNYEGWNEPQRDVFHIGSGEIRALF